MRIEAVGKSFIYRWPDGEVHLQVGVPIDLPDERAKRLLSKAGNRVRLVSIQSGDLVAWTRADKTTPIGLVDFVHLDADGNTWAFVTVGKSWTAVNLKFVMRIDAGTRAEA